MTRRQLIKQRKQAVKDVITIIVVMIPLTGWAAVCGHMIANGGLFQ